MDCTAAGANGWPGIFPMKYSVSSLNQRLPSPETLMLLADVILFLLNVFFLSGSFSKKMKKQLKELSVITEKIAENNLEFETKASDIKEINEVMVSLGQMKEALQGIGRNISGDSQAVVCGQPS